HANDGMAAVDGSISDARALDAAADPGVFRALVNVLHRFERLPDAAALAHDLAGAEGVTGRQAISHENVVAVDSDFFGENVHDPFDREVGLIGAEAAHRSAGRIVG